MSMVAAGLFVAWNIAGAIYALFFLHKPAIAILHCILGLFLLLVLPGAPGKRKPPAK